MADDERMSYEDLEHKVEELEDQVDILETKCENLEDQLDKLDDELAAAENTIQGYEEMSGITAAEVLVSDLKGRDQRAKTAVLAAIETGVTSDLWQVL